MAKWDADPEASTQMLINAGILYRYPDGSVGLPPLDPPTFTAVFF
jgi:hypothetical protein